MKRGGAEHGLPADYVLAAIHAIKSVPDPNPQREREERAKLRFDAMRGA